MIIAVVGEKGVGKTTIAIQMAMVLKKQKKDSLLVEVSDNMESSLKKYLSSKEICIGWNHFDLKKSIEPTLKEYRENGKLPFLRGPVTDVFADDCLEIKKIYKNDYDVVLLDVSNEKYREVYDIADLVIRVVDYSRSWDVEKKCQDIVIYNKKINGINSDYIEHDYKCSRIHEIKLDTSLINNENRGVFNLEFKKIDEIEKFMESENLIEKKEIKKKFSFGLIGGKKWNQVSK